MYGPPPPSQYGMHHSPHAPMAAFQCRACGYAGNAMIIEKISSGGWIAFVLLLFVCLPLCWIPLIWIKDRRSQCPNCRVLC
jgi:hypothetical protein